MNLFEIESLLSRLEKRTQPESVYRFTLERAINNLRGLIYEYSDADDNTELFIMKYRALLIIERWRLYSRN